METVPQNNPAFYQKLEIDILARTIWGEARGDGLLAMRKVGHVILNRAKISEKHGRYWWGNNIIQICQKPYQFSVWNRSDPNFRKLQTVDENTASFRAALRIARSLIYDDLPDLTDGATHYHKTSIAPYWAKNEQPVKTYKNHAFYRLV